MSSVTFSTSSGSDDNLKVPVRCGLRSKSRQIRPMVDFDRPLRAAIDARDQCVAFFGVCSSVVTTTSSIRSRLIEGGRPGRGSSISPSSRELRNRCRHLDTVSGCTPSCPAICLLALPSAHASTIFDRTASTCEDFAR